LRALWSSTADRTPRRSRLRRYFGAPSAIGSAGRDCGRHAPADKRDLPAAVPRMPRLLMPDLLERPGRRLPDVLAAAGARGRRAARDRGCAASGDRDHAAHAGRGRAAHSDRGGATSGCRAGPGQAADAGAGDRRPTVAASRTTAACRADRAARAAARARPDARSIPTPRASATCCGPGPASARRQTGLSCTGRTAARFGPGHARTGRPPAAATDHLVRNARRRPSEPDTNQAGSAAVPPAIADAEPWPCLDRRPPLPQLPAGRLGQGPLLPALRHGATG